MGHEEDQEEEGIVLGWDGIRSRVSRHGRRGRPEEEEAWDGSVGSEEKDE